MATALLLPTVALAASDYWVGPGGTGAGTSAADAAPTISAVLATPGFTPGSRIHVLPGTIEDAVTINTGVSIFAEDPSKPTTVTPPVGVQAPVFTVNNVTGADATVTITGLTITGGQGAIWNAADTAGGGIFFWQAHQSVVVRECTITGNSAYRGGGFFAFECSPNLVQCLIVGNVAYSGSALCEVNTAPNRGAYLPQLNNCTITKNVGVTSTMTFNRGFIRAFNTIIWDNPAQQLYDGPMSGGTAVIDNSVVPTPGDTGWGTGNVCADPRFVSPDTGDFHLQPRSPAIDFAQLSDSPSADISGTPRPQGLWADMGVYEYVFTMRTATADATTTAEDTSVTVNVLDNDDLSESLRTPRTAVGISNPAHGTLKTSAAGDITYTPDKDWNGVDTFTYRADYVTTQTAPATVTITVSPVNDAPVAVDDTLTADGVSRSLNVLDNDTDIDTPHASLTATSFSVPSTGTVEVAPSGDVTYTPPANYKGTATFTYQAFDGSAYSNTATVTVTITPGTDYWVAEGGTGSGVDEAHPAPTITSVLARIGARRGCRVHVLPGTINDVVNVQTGVSIFAEDPSKPTTVTPPAGAEAPVFTINDVTGADATVTITGLTITGGRGAIWNAADTAGGGIFFWQAHQSVVVRDCIIKGNSAYRGGGFFAFECAPNLVQCVIVGNVATAGGALGAVNTAPTRGVYLPQLNNCTVTKNVGVTSTMNFNRAFIRAFNTIIWDNPAQQLYDGPISGPTAVIDNSVVPTPGDTGWGTGNVCADPMFASPDTSDFHLQPRSPAIDYARLSDSPSADISGTPRPQGLWADMGVYEYVFTKRNATADTTTTAEDTAVTVNVLDNDDLSESLRTPRTAVNISNPAHGTLATSAAGVVTYTPDKDWNGVDTFTYRADYVTTQTALATVTITVSAVNDAPVARDDSATVKAGGTLEVAAPGVLTNDTDVDGDPLTAVIATPPSHASAFTLRADGSFEYTPLPSFAGTETYTYRAFDGASNSNTATVSIKVGEKPSDFVVPTGDTVPAGSSQTVTFTVGAPDSFTFHASGEPTPSLTWAGVLPAGIASSTVGDAGTLSGTPGAGSAGSYDATLTAVNGAGSASIRVHIVVRDLFTITPSAGAHGAISPSTATTVAAGDSKTFIVTPDPGYLVYNVTVDGEAQGALSSYTFTDVSASHTIGASFINNAFQIAPKAGEHGTISPSTTQTVPFNTDSPLFTFTPYPGYHVSSVLIDGVSIGATSTFVFHSVAANHTIEARFDPLKPIVRIGDSSPYLTSIKVARAMYPSWGGVRHVLLSSGDIAHQPDSLTGAGLARAYDGPLLLVGKNTLNPETRDAILAMPPGVQVHILGGPRAVSTTVLRQVRALGSVKSVDRIYGNDRYATAAAIATRMKKVMGRRFPTTAIVAPGADRYMLDPLVASTVSASMGYPVLLTKSNVLNSTTRAALKKLRIKNRYILGTKTAVSERVRKSLGVPSSRRIRGTDVYSDSVAFAAYARARGWLDGDTLGFSATMPDTAASGSFMASRGAPLILVRRDSVPRAVLDLIGREAAGIESGYVFGGEAALSEAVREQLEAKLNNP